MLGAGAGGAGRCGDGHASSGGEVPGESAGVWGALVVGFVVQEGYTTTLTMVIPTNAGRACGACEGGG